MPAKVKPFFECEFAQNRTPFPKSPQLNVLTAPAKPNGGIAGASVVSEKQVVWLEGVAVDSTCNEQR